MSKNKRRINAILLLIVISLAAFLFGWSNAFNVKAISITGVNASEEKLVMTKIENQPQVMKVGIPLARVDKRVVGTRVSELRWIKTVTVKRNWISKEIKVEITKRIPIARISNSNNRTFIDNELEIFTIPTNGSLPEEMLNLPDLNLKDQTPSALTAFDLLRRQISEIKPIEINAEELVVQTYQINSSAYMLTTLLLDGRSINVIWGTSQDLALKIKVFRELLKLPENLKVVRMDLTAPLAPIVK